jgi:hypothetical protein
MPRNGRTSSRVGFRSPRSTHCPWPAGRDDRAARVEDDKPAIQETMLARDDEQASGGARSAPTSLLHLWKAAVAAPVSPSMPSDSGRRAALQGPRSLCAGVDDRLAVRAGDPSLSAPPATVAASAGLTGRYTNLHHRIRRDRGRRRRLASDLLPPPAETSVADDHGLGLGLRQRRCRRQYMLPSDRWSVQPSRMQRFSSAISTTRNVAPRQASGTRSRGSASESDSAINEAQPMLGVGSRPPTAVNRR